MICVRSPSWFECPEVLQFSRFSSVINDPSTAVSSQPTSVVLLNASPLLVVSLIFLFSFLLFFPFRFFFLAIIAFNNGQSCCPYRTYTLVSPGFSVRLRCEDHVGVLRGCCFHFRWIGETFSPGQSTPAVLFRFTSMECFILPFPNLLPAIFIPGGEPCRRTGRRYLQLIVSLLRG